VKLGSAWMLVAGASFATMGLLVKRCVPYFSADELVFYRSLFGLILVGALPLYQGCTLKTRYWSMHLMRSLCGLASLWLFFFTLARVPLATAVTLNYTSPLFFAFLLTVLGREPVARSLLFSLGTGFIGVLLVLQPHVASSEWLSGCTGLLSGLTAGISYLYVRHLGQVGEPEWRIVFYFSGLSTLVLGAVVLLKPHHPLTFSHPGLLVSLGAVATLGQWAMARAYRTGKSLLVANFAFSTVLFSCILGAVFLNEKLDAHTWWGILAVILAGIMSTMIIRRHNEAQLHQNRS
jgi:drug/metabolite transporter (DMT)-like permease